LLKSKLWREEKRKDEPAVHVDFEYDDPDEFEEIS
jgi:hypothetical protein